MTISQATQDYIRNHQNDDVRALALKGCQDPDVDLSFALQQIQGRQKAKGKLPEMYDNPDIIFPPTVSMEQCSSEATARYKASLVHGDTFADLTGGFGVDTLALAESFQQGYYVESSAELCQLFEHNIHALGIGNILIWQGTMEEVLPTLPEMDILYLDPSRRDGHGQRVVALTDCTPNVPEHKDALLGKARQGVLVKLSPMLDIKAALQQLPETREIHVLAVHGECKEILFLLGHDKAENIEYHAVNIQGENVLDFQFSGQEEADAMPELADGVGKYLLEPNAAVMKAGAFKCVATRYGLRKLHAHSHLYTCDEPVADFPGRVFTVEKVVPFSKKEVKRQLAGIGKANVAVRNFPLTADALRQQLKLGDGGDVYLFGTTLRAGGKVLVVTRK
ncbi:MAG: SAM-dependent methyltransferase [Bacteroidales bacterium]|nr:SAM-dependent methyltransferase [Bacteroidales bacterium]